MHDDPQLVYASAGVLEVQAVAGVWFTPASRAIWVPAGAPHAWRVHGTTTVHLVGFPEAVTRAGDNLQVHAAGVPTLVQVSALVRELAIASSRVGRAPTPADQRLLTVLFEQLRPLDHRATMLPVLHDERLRDVERVVVADLAHPRSLPELGRLVGASERTLSRLFHEQLRTSFTSWRTQVRLHHATLLLSQGSSVTAVAAACGFSSPSAFISTFKAAFGQTPGQLYG